MSIATQPPETSRLQDEISSLLAEVERLRGIVSELEDSGVMISDSKYDLEKAIADASLSAYAYPLDCMDGWEIKEGKYTVKVNGPALECEAEIEADGLTAGVRFGARLVGLVFEASN